MTIDLLQSGMEQGNIGSSGNTSSTKYLRTIGYIPYSYGLYNTVTINATSSNTSKTVQCYLMGYISDITNTRLFSQGAYAVPHDFDISSYKTVKFVRVVIRYSDTSVITPEELTSCTLSYDYVPLWTMEGDVATPTSSLSILSTGFTKPYPASLWRIDENNDGYPYNELMPDILYHEPAPPPPEPEDPERANWLHHWFIRYNDIGAARSSVMSYISQKSDKSFKPYNFKLIPHWNTSIESLNQQYKRLLGDNPTNGLIEWIIENT